MYAELGFLCGLCMSAIGPVATAPSEERAVNAGGTLQWMTRQRLADPRASSLMCRHYHPSPPARTVKQERTFEGISLDQPGSSSRQVPVARCSMSQILS